jgi:hypothetical protein
MRKHLICRQNQQPVVHFPEWKFYPRKTQSNSIMIFMELITCAQSACCQHPGRINRKETRPIVHR